MVTSQSARQRLLNMFIWLGIAFIFQPVACVLGFIVWIVGVSGNERFGGGSPEGAIITAVIASTLIVPISVFAIARPGDKKSWYFIYGCGGTISFLPIWIYLVDTRSKLVSFAESDLTTVVLALCLIVGVGSICAGTSAIAMAWRLRAEDFSRF